MAESVVCPFCGYHSHAYAVQLHIEEHHTDDSPFVAGGNSVTTGVGVTADPDPRQQQYTPPHEQMVRCTRNGCGEDILLSNIDEHLDLHMAISLVEEENQAPDSSRNLQSPLEESTRDTEPTVGSPRRDGSRKLQKSQRRNSQPEKEQRRWPNPFVKASVQGMAQTRSLHRPRNPGRLGEKELGPHAFEKSMPPDVHKALLSGAQPRYVNRIGRDGRLVRETVFPNETAGLIGALADLCALDRSNDTTYLCHASARHVEKLPADGNFCGYWNIQMLLTYVQHMVPDGPQRLPDVPQMQRVIERAWDGGICAYGRVETGGVAGTRKWIGTHEALAFFTQIGVRVDALCFRHESGRRTAAEDLLDHVEALFLSSSGSGLRHGSSCITDLPPVYFQRLGHSMTIVGLEKKRDGSRNLLVFDPSFGTTDEMLRLLAKRTVRSSLDAVLRPYRRSEQALGRWDEFEVIVYVLSLSRTADKKILLTDGIHQSTQAA